MAPVTCDKEIAQGLNKTTVALLCPRCHVEVSVLGHWPTSIILGKKDARSAAAVTPLAAADDAGISRGTAVWFAHCEEIAVQVVAAVVIQAIVFVGFSLGRSWTSLSQIHQSSSPSLNCWRRNCCCPPPLRTTIWSCPPLQIQARGGRRV